MNASFAKRFIAYIMDMIIVSMAIALIWAFIPSNSGLKKAQSEMSELSVQCAQVTDAKGFNGCFKEMNKLSYEIDKQSVIKSVVNFVLVILYFVILQYYNKGRTLGKMLMGIKVEKNDGTELKLNDVTLRSLFVNSLFFNMVAILCILFVKEAYYFATITVLMGLQSILVVAIGIMVMAKKDRRGLHDLVAKTKVVETR